MRLLVFAAILDTIERATASVIARFELARDLIDDLQRIDNQSGR